MGKPGCSSSSSSSALGNMRAPRIERKIIEKNRRNRMKGLCSNLISLLPNHTSKQLEGLPLPYQIDEAVEYIKSMEMKLEELRQKEESLRKRCDTRNITLENQTTSKRPPLVEVHDMGPNLDVIIANGLNDYSTFHDIIRFLHQQGLEVASASFSRDGNSTVQVLQDKVGKSKLCLGGQTISRKLKELVCGASTSEVVESQLNLWDYEIESDDIWGFEIPEVLLTGVKGYFGEIYGGDNFYVI
ncbi:Transcription factor [Sesamum alatum]|uniref:Transcription factor n=1 Tax=Sesamum alatum TaxID=300844 RepID=A0AAE1YXZ6_9LAMI|nr:Transcription factor [Sesamum alatum]